MNPNSSLEVLQRYNARTLRANCSVETVDEQFLKSTYLDVFQQSQLHIKNLVVIYSIPKASRRQFEQGMRLYFSNKPSHFNASESPPPSNIPELQSSKEARIYGLIYLKGYLCVQFEHAPVRIVLCGEQTIDVNHVMRHDNRHSMFAGRQLYDDTSQTST